MRSSGARATGLSTVWVMVSCALTLVVAYLNKARCAGAPFDLEGRSLGFNRLKDSVVCYSDIQYLWGAGREINHHVFPYIDGGITAHGALVGGTVEYPVLSGVLMWLGALGARTDAEFLRNSALLLAPFALVTAWWLARMRGYRALLWAVAPPLVLYAFHNWELPVVATSVAAIYLVERSRWTVRTRGVLAAVLLGIGFCLKLYPGAFVVPLAAYVLTGGADAVGEKPARPDVRGAFAVVVAGVTTVVAINMPFIVAGYHGWAASFTFQQHRRADITTNSIWYWGLRPLFDHHEEGERAFQGLVSVASPTLVLASFALAVMIGWRRYQTTGVYPWIGVSAAMLCGFLLFHKVHSPQYTLWLIPFLVLARIRWSVVIAYLVADIAVGVGVFRYFHYLTLDLDAHPVEWIVKFGVWAKAALLVYLFFAFLRAQVWRDREDNNEIGEQRDDAAVNAEERVATQPMQYHHHRNSDAETGESAHFGDVRAI